MLGLGLTLDQVDVVAVRQLEPGDAGEVPDLADAEDLAVEPLAALELASRHLHGCVLQPQGRHQPAATSPAWAFSQRASSSVK